MARKTHGLGRGLDSLFSDLEAPGAAIQEIPVGELDTNPDQPRQTFDAGSIEGLAASIREQGILQPLLVAATSGGRYRIIAGERRYRAARAAGLETVPCIVKDIDVLQQMEVALIENLQREDLNPMDTARGIDALMKQYGYTQERAAERLGMSRPSVANVLRLLQLPEEVRNLLRDGVLTEGHGRALAGIRDNAERQIQLARRAAEQKLSVRELEKLAKESQPARKPAARKSAVLAPELSELQDKLRLKTGLKSELRGDIHRGRIVLQYSSRDELEYLNELLDGLREREG